MSPRRSDPRTRPALVDIAARLLAEEGPRALSTRRIAAEAGTSTMVVYTHFGAMSELVREMVREGFARLEAYLTRVEPTGDPVSDMALLGRAYRMNARANPHLYAVMFSGASPAGFSLSEADRQHGRYTLVHVVDCAARCFAAGRFRAGDAELVAHQMWIAVHGLVTLELGGYLIDPYDPASLFESQLVSLMVSAGDALDLASASVAASAERVDETFGADLGRSVVGDRRE
ncbi:TetR/AcrR family transcriptional regulator [Streptosporangiaceae bacterium NEAU-GS5]|nr:TetR/AcrR family transcriptional regulator [Streptosporangiaceae bacterium NEAU-GS5]